MKVLFIGGTGVISEGVSRVAVERGVDLYLLNRGQRNLLFPNGAKQIQGDIREPQSISEILRNHHFDVVVDWVAYNPEHVRTDIDLFRDRADQYIYISSASAYQKPVMDYLITESTPLANPYWQYSRDKIAGEELLMNEYRKTGFPVTIIRPSLTYGLSMIPASVNSWQKPWSLIDRIRKGKKIIIPGDGTSLWVITHNTDFAKGIIGLFGNRRALGQAFHITSDEVLTWNQIYEEIGRAAGAKINPVHISSDFLAEVIPDARGSLIGDKVQSVVFDNSKIKRYAPGFTATVPFAEGIRRTVAWFEAHPELCIIDQAWDHLMDLISGEYEAALATAKIKISGT